MEEKLEEYYKKYKVINALIKQEMETKDILYNKLIKTKVGKLYFSLNEEQKESFRDIYSDSDILKYYNTTNNIDKYNGYKTMLYLEIVNCKYFPLNKESVTNLYIKNGVNTYNALTHESTEDLKVSDEIKLFMQNIINDIYGFNDNLTVDDIPLIKVIFEKIKNDEIKFPKNYISVTPIQDIIIDRVKRIHNLDKKHLTYKDNRRPLIKELKESILNTSLEIKNSDSSFKYLLLYLIDTAKYEVSMLEGKRVTALLKEIEESNISESDKDYFKDALVKAYYNLTNIDFRKECEYFDNDNDICYATFETANPIINSKILKMKNLY